MMVLLLLLLSVAFSQEQINSLSAYRMGYADGYSAGKKEGFEEGYKKAIEDFKKIYQEKLQEYKEIEAGRLLIKEWRVSAPRVYQVPTQNGSKVIIDGCRVIRPFDDLLSRIPLRKEEKTSEERKETAVAREPAKYIKAYVPEKYESALRESGAIYLKKEGSHELIVYFPSEEAKKDFCMRYKACKEE